MTLKTERLSLRPLCRADLKTVHEYASDIDNTKYMMRLPNSTEQQTEAFLRGVEAEWQKEHPGFYEFAITIENVQIGAVSIYLDETGSQGEIGWIINKKYWNRGYVTEAAGALLDFARNDLKLHGVVANCDIRNGASEKVMIKLGMKLACDKGMRTYTDSGETAGELTYMLEFT